MTGITRRELLRGAVGVAAGMAASSALGCEGDEAASDARHGDRALQRRGGDAARDRIGKDPSVVVVARDPKVADGWEVDEARLRDLLSRAMAALGDGSDARDVWRTLYHPSDVVGLKVNALAGIPASTHPEVTFAVADALRSVDLQDKNIIIWDRAGVDLKRGGFTLNSSGSGYRCLGTDAPGVGYESDHVFHGKVGSRLSRVLTSVTTAQVNLPVLKDHGLAGVSGALKNYYGAIHNPNKYHDNNCDPWVADVNALSVIRDQSRLVICDGIYALCNGGPGFKERWAWNFNGLVVGTDPVAVDRVMWSIIETRRKEVGLKPLEDAGRPPRWLETAVDKEHRLGVGDLARIKRVDV